LTAAGPNGARVASRRSASAARKAPAARKTPRGKDPTR